MNYKLLHCFTLLFAIVTLFSRVTGKAHDQNEDPLRKVYTEDDFTPAKEFTWPIPVAEIPAWVIALERTPLRYQLFLTSSYASQVFPKLEKFPAVDGSKLSIEDDERITSSARVNILEKYRRAHSEISTKGMAGLYMSHVELWKEFLNTGEPVGIVFEDDCYVPRNGMEQLEKAMKSMPHPSQWDVWLLGALTHLKSVATRPISRNFGPGWTLAVDWFGTHAYMITRRGALALLEEAYPMSVQVDAYMTQMALVGKSLTLWRASEDVNWPQFGTWAGTTVQELYCDTCDLPSEWSKDRDEYIAFIRGVLIGFLYFMIPWAAITWLVKTYFNKLKLLCAAISRYCRPKKELRM